MISRIIKVSERVISLSLRLQLITLYTSTFIILDITNASSNNNLLLIINIIWSWLHCAIFCATLHCATEHAYHEMDKIMVRHEVSSTCCNYCSSLSCNKTVLYIVCLHTVMFQGNKLLKVCTVLTVYKQTL